MVDNPEYKPYFRRFSSNKIPELIPKRGATSGNQHKSKSKATPKPKEDNSQPGGKDGPEKPKIPKKSKAETHKKTDTARPRDTRPQGARTLEIHGF